MAARKKAANQAAKVSDLAVAARENPLIQRLVEDAELRDNAQVAFTSAKSAYTRLNNGKPLPKQLLDDKKLQRDLRVAADALRDVGGALQDGPKKKKRGKGGLRLVLVAVVGAGAALALSEGLRSKVLDLLFGKEEEFDYTSTTTPGTA